MSAVFISYRRDDSAGHTGRLYDHLYEKLGKEYVFMDIDTIEPGMDFVKAIDKEIKNCAVLIVVIGDEWLTASDDKGRRLDDPNDFIHIEIASALRRDLRIIPVLVKGAKMPAASELPDDIAALARRHALELSDSRWDYDINRLLTTLSTSLEKPSNENKKVPFDDGGKKTIKSEKILQTAHRKKSNLKLIFLLALGISLITLLAIFLYFQPDEIEIVANKKTDGEVTTSTISRSVKTEPEETTDNITETVNKAINSETLSQAAKEMQIEKLISNAAEDIRAFRLTSPPGNNAVEKYREILKIAPDHPAAVDGIKHVAVRYISLAESAIEKGKLKKANNHLKQARDLYPELDDIYKLEIYISKELLRIEHSQSAERAREIQRESEPEAQRFQTTNAERQAKQAQKKLKICIEECGNQLLACQEKQQPAASNCESEVKMECEKEREACLNDPQVYLLWGEFGADAECNGRWQQCIDKQTQRCMEQESSAISDCEPAFTSCKNSCR